MRHRPISYALALLLLPIACDEATNDGVLAEERKPLGKADASGSCFAPDPEADFCGSKSAGSCWCDEQCEFYGDCCGDVALACGTTEDTGDTGNAHTLEHAVVAARIQVDGLLIEFDGSAYWSDYGGDSRYKLKAKFVLTSDDVTLPDA